MNTAIAISLGVFGFLVVAFIITLFLWRKYGRSNGALERVVGAGLGAGIGGL